MDIKQCWIGVDQSIHSTGVTIQFSDKPNIIYLQICDSKEKHSSSVIFCIYNRVRSEHKDFSLDEINLTKSAHNLFATMYHYIKLHCSNYSVWNVGMEGQVMSGFSKFQMFRLTDLVKLKSILEYNFLRIKNVKLNIFTPTSIKKYFTGSGRAKKEDMINEFASRVTNFDFIGKIDDVIDSYAICEMLKSPNTPKILPNTRKKQTKNKQCKSGI